MWTADALAVFPFKYTCVCSEVTCQEAILPGGLDSMKMAFTGQLAYWATQHGFMHQLPPFPIFVFFLNLDGDSLELSNPNCSEP